jgi:hypothetical protein
MSTDGTWSCSATTFDGSGDGVALGVGSIDALGSAEALGTTVGDGIGVAVAVGRAMSGRLGPGSAPGSVLPRIMRVTPTTPSTIGSAQLARRLTAGV